MQARIGTSLAFRKIIIPIVVVASLLVGGCVTTNGHVWTQSLETSTTAEMIQLRANLMRATSVRTIEPPLDYPSQRRWSPRRFFGALYGNSPEIHLNRHEAAFVYNRYFSGHIDAAVFEKYYGAPLPSNQPSLANAIPGTLPTNGFLDVRLGFDKLTYSSHYGGSFKMTFRSLEDYQVEYRSGGDAWDIASLEMLVYVRPIPANFNPNYPVSYGIAYVEFRPRGVIGYTISGSPSTTEVKDGDPLPALMEALAATAKTVVGGATGTTGGVFRRESARFSHGLVHAAFWDDIGQTNNVTAIEISDDYFFPRTTAGRPVAVVSFQAHDVRLDTEPGSEEIYITIDAAHMFENVEIPPTFSWELPEIDHRESTWWRSVGIFPLDWDCGQLQSIILMLDVREDDDVFDDDFLTDPIAFQTGSLDCAGMQSAFTNGRFGFYENLPDESLLIVRDDDVVGALTARMRVSVVKQ